VVLVAELSHLLLVSMERFTQEQQPAVDLDVRTLAVTHALSSWEPSTTSQPAVAVELELQDKLHRLRQTELFLLRTVLRQAQVYMVAMAVLAMFRLY
jgi:hypothetical protein